MNYLIKDATISRCNVLGKKSNIAI